MEHCIGRLLTDNEVVHHINGIKTDNRGLNLQLMTRAEHIRHHETIDMTGRKCSECGSDKTGLNKRSAWIPRPNWYHNRKGDLVCKNCYKRMRWHETKVLP